MKISVFFLTVTSLFLTSHTTADESETVAPPAWSDPHQTNVGRWQFALSAGDGSISNPLANRPDIQGTLMPLISYYGERFYFENSFIGYSLIEREHWYLDVVGALNEDGMYFNLDGVNQFGWWDALGISGGYVDLENGGSYQPPGSYQDIHRHLSYLAGLSLHRIYPFADVRVSMLKDISGVHHGHEIHFNLRKSYAWQQWRLRWQVGLSQKDQRLNNYYYNIRPHEINHQRSWFELKQSLNFHYGFTLSYQLNKDWALQAHWQKQRFDRELENSPLVGDLQSISRFIGVRYSF